MECLTTSLKDARLIKPKLFKDDRGFFLETWQQQAYDNALNNGNPLLFKQDNHSHSAKNILRGLHYQLQHPQGKLVRVIAGCIYDVIVDLRHYSPTFAQWQGFYLSAEEPQLLWIPPGFAHGFYTLCEETAVSYKCTEYYHPEDEHSIIWNDTDLNIQWPLLTAHCTSPKLSIKDLQGHRFREATYFYKETAE